MLYQTINTASQFRDQFHRCGRGDQFSYEALGLLFDHLESLGSDVELDVVGVCCEFIEQDYKDIFNTYDISCDDDEPTDDDIKASVVAYLAENTSIVGVTSTGSIVYEQF